MEAELRRCRSSYDLEQCGTYEHGRYRSQWYRGLEKQMEWLRLSLEGPEDLLVRVYTVDEQPGTVLDVDNMIPAMERRANDLLLYGVYGQYLCFTVEPCQYLKGFSIEFPGHSVDSGLPAVMQGDQTLRKLLAVYQSRFMDLNHDIRRFTRCMDTESPAAMSQLPRWLGASRWSQDDGLFHKVLPYAHELARLRGTRRGLNLLSEVVTGFPCRIVEGWQLKQRPGEWQESCWTCGEAGEGITVLVSSSVSPEDAQQFRSLLTDFIPLGAPYQMVYLADDAPMDGHSYLDQNVSLTAQAISRMDGPEQDEVILT